MHDTPNLGAQAIDQQVHGDFARHAPFASYTFSFHVNHNHIRRTHPAFADARGSYKNPFFVQPDGQVPVRCRNEPARVQQPPEFDNGDTIPAVARHKHTLFGHGTARSDR